MQINELATATAKEH